MKDAEISNRIALLRFLMIFGVVLVHTPPTLKVDEMDGTLWAYLVSFLQNGVFRAGVPVLTVISGFLLFSSNSDLSYLRLLKKKAASLLIPFLLFNVGHIALQLVLRLVTGKWLGEDLIGQNVEMWMNSLFSLRKPPENEPLHFLRELIVLVVLSPIFGMLIRRAPIAGLVVVSALFLTNSDGFLINRSDMPVEFYVGGLAAVYRWNLKALDRFSYVSFILFCAACAIVITYEIDDITWLRLMAPILVWSAVSPLVQTRLGKWLASMSIFSFFIYLTHAPLMRFTWIVFQKIAPGFPVPLFTAISPFAIAAVCIGLYKAAHVLLPAQLNWALGSRGEKRHIASPLPETVKAGNEHAPAAEETLVPVVGKASLS